jgi:SAM-dependent methyltransferase
MLLRRIEKMSFVGARALSANQILGLHKAPLYSVDGFSLSDGFLDIVGLVLAPGGDPSKVRVDVDQGVEFQWHYPLPNPGAFEYYWYWPKSDQTQYRLRINLAESKNQDDAFRVRFIFDAPELTLSNLKDTFYVPKDINAYQNFPGASNLSRVQYFDNINGVVVRGYSDYRRLRAIAMNYGLDLNRAKILDWGCGYGRVIRHFSDIGPDADLHGVDIDLENVNWANDNLPRVSVIHGPLMPPLPYSDASFDFIFGISVMTHLPEHVQRAWLRELERITRAGALVLVTFSGDTDVAFTSRMLDQTYIDDYLKLGRGHDLPSDDLVGKIADPTYYKNVKVSAKAVRALCDPTFEVLDVLECMFGYQDLAVLRRR